MGNDVVYLFYFFLKKNKQTRWTDSAVRTIATALFLNRQDIHFFNDVAFTSNDKTHCPLDFTLLERCSCDYKNSFSKFNFLTSFFVLTWLYRLP